jgi:hypothetical protein
MLVAMIHSKETQDGFYEQPVYIPDGHLLLSSDPLSLLQRTIEEHLQVCTETTGIPLNVGIWMIEFNPEIRTRFNLPKGVVI